ncbi:hypothetical protein R1sor_001853 [Riccia sorocarpa]|uniref:Uncharacterized protein n=1 Tax=Riccia sorocarpa TaxID=122646 RepID=A0ABD3H1B0_9MARC
MDISVQLCGFGIATIVTSSLLAGVGCETQPAEQDAHGGTVQTANTESPENTSVDGSDPDNGVHADGEETLDNSVPTTDEDMDDWLIDNEEAVTDTRGSNESPMPAPIDSEQDFQDDLNKVGFSSIQSKEEGSATKKKGDILTAQSSPKASSPLSKYLGRKAAPASQHRGKDSTTTAGSAPAPNPPCSPITRSRSRKTVPGELVRQRSGFLEVLGM